MEKKLWEIFMQKNCRKNLELKKYLNGKEINYLSNGNDIIILLIAGLIKTIL